MVESTPVLVDPMFPFLSRQDLGSPRLQILVEASRGLKLAWGTRLIKNDDER